MDIEDCAVIVKQAAQKAILKDVKLIENLKKIAGSVASQSSGVIALEHKIEELENVVDDQDEIIQKHHHPFTSLNAAESVLLSILVVVLLAGITFDSVYIQRSPTMRDTITVGVLLIAVFGFFYIFFVAGREIYTASHKKKIKAKLPMVNTSAS